MAISGDFALQMIAKDERQLLEYLFQLDQMKVNRHGDILDILENYIVSSLTDANGYLVPNALTEAQIEDLETQLLNMYAPGVLDDLLSQSIDLVDARLLSIDTLMRDLELESGVLGSSVFEMETVQEETNRIAQGLVRGAYGEGDYRGSVERIQDSMNRYRLDRSKSEFTLRSELMETLQRDAGAGTNHANSVAITSMVTVDRKLRRVQADRSGTEHGLYSGPFDDLIRPFCNDWLGQVQTWDFWDSLRNDMPVGLFDHPASVYCGGINCRHRIISWELSWEDGRTDLRDKFAAYLAEEFRKSPYDLKKIMKAA